MTTKPMTCDRFAEVLADFLERDVDDSTRAAVESHALGCEDCGALLADLRTLRIDAANLPVLAPSRDLWAGIARRIEAPVVELPGRGARDASRVVDRSARHTRRWIPISAAAAALVAITAGTTYYMATRRPVESTARQVASTSLKPATVPGSVSPVSPTPSAQDSSTAPASASSARSRSLASGVEGARLVSNRAAKPSAEEVYGAEIARLKRIVDMRRSGLDTATLNVIEKNLAVIDSAIAQCRAALAKDPASRYLIQSLNSSFETKVELLRTAAQLPSHS